MVVNEIWFEMKDGRKALIRSPREEDIPEECSKYTYEGEKALFERLNASQEAAMLVCIVDGKVAGNCEITFNQHLKTRHRASVAITLLREFWNQGIGTRMFREMIRIAEQFGGILQMELEFVEGNDRARHLYEKMGFRIAGVRPNAIRLKNGTLLNEYIMIREMKSE